MKKILSTPRNLAQRGFTLIELLIVIGILVVLLSITLIAINPARQFAQADNTQRRSDVNAILNAVHQFGADNNGTYPAAITETSTEIGSAGIDICSDLVSMYLAAFPVDPDTGTGDAITEAGCGGTYVTGYEILDTGTNNRITVAAPSAELSAVISVTR